MTPKQKAKELVDKFMMIDADSEWYDDFQMGIFYAQRCALICVDEIVESLDKSLIDADIEYYKQVKREIEKQ